jgi:hypothetical protein
VISRHPEVLAGERLFGYLPIGNDVVPQPGRLSRGQLAEASPHRPRLDLAHNHHLRVGGTPRP